MSNKKIEKITKQLDQIHELSNNELITLKNNADRDSNRNFAFFLPAFILGMLFAIAIPISYVFQADRVLKIVLMVSMFAFILLAGLFKFFETKHSKKLQRYIDEINKRNSVA